MDGWMGSMYYLHIFQELFYFRVVLCFDLLLVAEVFLRALMFCVLEAVAIKGVFILIPANIMNNGLLGDGRALISVWLTVCLVSEWGFSIFERKKNSLHIIGSWCRSITRIPVIVQIRRNVMFCNLCLLGERFDDLTECMADGLLNCSTSHD